MSADKIRILLVIPSKIISKGISSILEGHAGFQVETTITSISRENESVLRNSDADVIIVDPSIFDYYSRMNIRKHISELCDAKIVAMPTCPMPEDSKRSYDEIINLFDSPATIINKLRNSCRSENNNAESYREELSNREKEILVCVAKGMLNKEIADKFNLSIYTVITHRKNITRKIGIKTVAGLTVYALLNNLIDPTTLE